jgi:hypothetical protein
MIRNRRETIIVVIPAAVGLKVVLTERLQARDLGSAESATAASSDRRCLCAR